MTWAGSILTAAWPTIVPTVGLDPVDHRLWVADEQMANHPHAIAILGQRSEESHSTRLEADRSGMDQLVDPRGLVFDSENQRLYASDSSFARVMLYSFPESAWKLDMPARGVREFISLDPYVGLTPWEAK